MVMHLLPNLVDIQSITKFKNNIFQFKHEARRQLFEIMVIIPAFPVKCYLKWQPFSIFTQFTVVRVWQAASYITQASDR